VEVGAIGFIKAVGLSTVQLDSWYVRIWVEMGVVGLSLHLLHLFICLGVGMYNITRIKDPHLRTQMIALAAGFFWNYVCKLWKSNFRTKPNGCSNVYEHGLFLYMQKLG